MYVTYVIVCHLCNYVKTLSTKLHNLNENQPAIRNDNVPVFASNGGVMARCDYQYY